MRVIALQKYLTAYSKNNKEMKTISRPYSSPRCENVEVFLEQCVLVSSDSGPQGGAEAGEFEEVLWGSNF